MAESTRATTSSEEGGSTVARALRATTATVDRAGRAFIDHTRDCAPCRTRGEDCPDAASLREIWRVAREAATP
ncbi:hypothetical protein [Streptomyces sp. NPDC059015]|uniref:hypothetical protein n=1 Tax=unclassified Streptomyces TaxID=2593676 RepID=UPI003677A134